jgi:hypothetical protein
MVEMVAIVIVIAIVTVVGAAMEYNSHQLKFSTLEKIFIVAEWPLWTTVQTGLRRL